MKRGVRIALYVLGLIVLGAILQRYGNVFADSRPAVAASAPSVTAKPQVQRPAPTSAQQSVAKAPSGTPAEPATSPMQPRAISLDNGPPPIKLYRCAAYARMLSELQGAADAAEMRRLADDLDAVVGLLAAEKADATSPDLAAVAAAERARAAEAGPRLENWLRESFARCDQEIAWLREVWGGPPS